MLLLETIQDNFTTFYCVIPVIDGKPSQTIEYVFENEQDQADFVDAYFYNNVAAHFAYFAMLEADRATR